MFVGFSFWKMPNSPQGLQNQLFAIFVLLTIFTNFCNQIMPHFVTQRSLYEARERPSKTYSWKVFILSNILVEIPWNSLMAILVFVGWYYPIGLHRNAVEADQVGERGILMVLFILTFLIFAGTFATLITAGLETAEGAGNLVNLLFSLSLIFCGYVKSSLYFSSGLVVPPHLHPVSASPQEEHRLTLSSQCPSNTHRPTWFLDIYVSSLPYVIPRFRHVIRWSRKLENHLFCRGISTFLPSFAL